MIAQRKFDKDHSINIRSSQRSIGLKPIYPNQDHSSASVGQVKEDHSHHSQASDAFHETQKIKDHLPKLQGKSFK
ncbi:hypothetical protein LguiA_012847 [Lonicera macranthoides]